MSLDTDRFAGELRERVNLYGPHSGLVPEAVLTRSRRARSRRATVFSLIAAGSVAAAVIAGPVVVGLGHRMAEAARDARWAQVAGVARDLGAPLQTAWQVDGRLAGVSEPSGTILLLGDHGYAAVDPGSGEQLWSLDIDPDDWWCSLSNPHPWLNLGADDGDADGPERVLCTNPTGSQAQRRCVLLRVGVLWPEARARRPDARTRRGDDVLEPTTRR